MSFTYPWVLLLLVLPIFLIVAPPSRAFGLVLPFDHKNHKSSRALKWLLAGFDRLPALILAMVILMLAGPKTLQRPHEKRSLTNIQICMDVSGSMSVENRYENARDAILDFVNKRQGDAFGLTLFGSHQIRWIPLTTDLDAIRNALPFANPNNQPMHMSGTRIGAALMFCRDNMTQEATQGDRLIVLVSDGESSDLGEGADTDHARELIDAGITLFHIHVGTSDVPPEIYDIAERTGGRAFAARDSASLKGVFDYIDRMKPAEFTPSGTIPMDDFGPFAVAALCLTCLQFIGLLGVRQTPW